MSKLQAVNAVARGSHEERAFAATPRLLRTTLVVIGFAALLTQVGSQAQVPTADALPFTKSYLLTGDYVTSSVDLPRGGGTAPLPFNATLGNAVPPNGVVVGAYLFWELLAPVGTPVVAASFRGLPISTAKATRIMPLPSGEANCWGSSGNTPRAVTAFRADVLDLLPKHYDAANKWTGRYIVNDAELTANGLPQNSVTLGVPGSGNTLITVAGATLALIYRIPPPSDGSPTAPLRKILMFDGAAVQPLGTITKQVLRGFFKSAASDASAPLPSETARWTILAGSGARNLTETLTFNGTLLPVTNPIPDPVGSGSDRGWAGVTFNVGALMPGVWDDEGNYGETVTVEIGHTNATPYECPSFPGMLFSVEIADADNDGVPDGMEIPEAAGGLRNPPTAAFPNGEPLPNLYGMGARVRDSEGALQPDAIVEVNAMVASPNTKYGDSTAPYRDNLPSVTDPLGHDHIPPPEVFRMLGKAYADGGVQAHFDVGDLDEYFSQYPCPDANPACHNDVIEYLVPSAYARGGERVSERACADCQFKFFPGTMGYPFGLQGYRDAIVGPNGEELVPTATQSLVQQLKAIDPEYPGVFRRRFDRVRQEYIRYLFIGHNRGRAKAALPCVKPDGSGAPFLEKNGEQACGSGTKRNPLYYVPLPLSGVAALPGNHSMVTLGSWDPENFVGTVYGQAATIWHELGHTTNLWHFGPEPIWGDKASNTPTLVEENCKPNLLTNMNYSYQLHGLPDNFGNLFLDYSRVRHDALTESGLNDAPLSEQGSPGGGRYRSAWFVPATSPLALEQGATPARRFCSGVTFGAGQPATAMARVVADSTTQAIDWDGNPATSSGIGVDINFDGSASGQLRGFDEWANLRLNQIGASRHVRLVKKWTLSPSGQPVDAGDLIDFGSGDLIDFGSGDLIDFGSGDLIDFGSGTHIVDFNSGTFLQYGAGDLIDFGSGDLLDFGSGDLIDFGSGGLVNVGPQAAKPGNISDANGDLIDFGSGDLIDFGSGDLIDFGSGDLIDFGSGDLIDFGSGDLIDFGSGDLIDFGSGTRELDFDSAFAMARPRPLGLTGCVLGGTTAQNGCDEPVPSGSLHRNKLSWNGPTFAVPSAYEIHRAIGANTVLIHTENAPNATTSPATTFIDPEELPNNVVARYWIKARYGPNGSEGTSAKSNTVEITGVNDVPQAVNDPVPANAAAYITTMNTALTVSVANGVLKNDTDVDSPIASRRLVRITQLPLYGALTARPDGSFDYVPFPGSYTGPDIFKYEVDNGLWPRDLNVPLNSADQALTEGTVTITIRPRGRR